MSESGCDDRAHDSRLCDTDAVHGQPIEGGQG